MVVKFFNIGKPWWHWKFTSRSSKAFPFFLAPEALLWKLREETQNIDRKKSKLCKNQIRCVPAKANTHPRPSWLTWLGIKISLGNRKALGQVPAALSAFSSFPCNQLGWIPWHSDNLMPLENWSLAKLWPAQLLPTHPTRSAARDGSWHLSISSSMVIASRNSSVESSTVASAQRPFQAIWGCPAIELRDVIWVKFLLYCDIFGKPEFFPYIPYEPEQWHLTSSNNLTASWKSSFQSS